MACAHSKKSLKSKYCRRRLAVSKRKQAINTITEYFLETSTVSFVMIHYYLDYSFQPNNFLEPHKIDNKDRLNVRIHTVQVHREARNFVWYCLLRCPAFLQHIWIFVSHCRIVDDMTSIECLFCRPLHPNLFDIEMITSCQVFHAPQSHPSHSIWIFFFQKRNGLMNKKKCN